MNPPTPDPSAAIPADRGHLLTEHRHPVTADLDALPVADLLATINDLDAQIPGIVRQAIPRIAQLVELAAERLACGGRLIYLGAGTSGRLGVLDASECPPTFHSDPDMVVGIIAGGDGALRKSSEGAEDRLDGAKAELDRLKIGENDVIVGIAAGGTTPYVLGALTLARQRRCATAMICCVPASDCPAGVDVVIALPTGPEPLTGSTRMRAGTATKLALNMISTAVMVRLGKVWGNLMVDLRATNDKLVDRAARILTQQCDLSRPEAIALLQHAEGSVKTALVMARLNVDAAEARARLAAHQGQLRPLLGSPRP